MPFRGADESLFTKMIKILFFRQIFPFPRKTEGFYQKRESNKNRAPRAFPRRRAASNSTP
jgi:hypothetical protein